MQKRIDGKMCDTEKATVVGSKAVGDYGDPTGYEEILYVNKMKQHFLYGNGGLDSKYVKPTMVLFTNEQATVWCKENGIAISKPEAVKPAKVPRTSKTVADKTVKAKEVKKPTVDKSKDTPEKEKKVKTKKADKASDDKK
jgi:hypothetical protein